MPPTCFLVEDDSVADAALNYIAAEETGLLRNATPDTIAQLKFSSSSQNYPTILERALHVCRVAKGLPKWNVLHLSESDSLRAIQLCLGEKAKQECGEFCVQASDVLAVHQRLANNAIYGEKAASGDIDTGCYERYLAESRLTDTAGVLRALKAAQHPSAREAGREEGGEGGTEKSAEGEAAERPVVIYGSPGSELERHLAAVLFGESVVAVRPAADLNGSIATKEEEPELEKRLDHVETLWHCVDVEQANRKASQTDLHIRGMFSSLFRLLVNSRDELALAAACQAPGLELSSQDFLAIRRTARTRSMPMYQTVVSHVRRVELGGKNYQPPADCPLHGCTPPLRALVDLVNKLHALLEEEADPGKCCLRLLAAMKSCLVRGTKLKLSAIEKVATELKGVIAAVAKDYASETDASVIGGRGVKMVRDLCDRLSCAEPPVVDHLSVLEDAMTSPATPGRSPLLLPSVVSMFRTPIEVDEDSNDAANLSLEERLRKKGIALSETPTTTKRYGATVSWLPASDSPAAAGSPAGPSPPLVAGPTLVCSRSGTKYAEGEGIRALRELQAADRAREKENKMLSPKTSKGKKRPKRSLFDSENPSKKKKADAPDAKKPVANKKAEVCEDQENVSVWDTKKQPKKRTTEAAADQENVVPGSDVSKKKQQEILKKPKMKQIKQVSGQKSIKDFFRF